MKVPFVDLKAQYLKLKDEIHSAIQSVLEDQKFIQGEHSKKFENDFCQIHGATFGLGCSNGTSALTACLRVMGIGVGDEVILPANTFFATAEAVVEVGATPVLCDCEAGTYSIDLISAESVLTAKTKAILPVHLYGLPVDMENVQRFAETHNLLILEDCAQAHLAKSNGKPVGSFGEFGTFSFYPGKNLGAYGDAGFITSSSQVNIERARKYINHGRVEKYEHDEFGTNFRMDGIQAAILSVKAKYISDWTKSRQAVAEKYDNALKNNGFKVIENKNFECVYHLYVVEVSNRDQVIEDLHEKGISSGIHYPIPLNLQPAFKPLGYKGGEFPVAESAADRILSLPIYPEISDEMMSCVADQFLSVAKV